MDDVANLPETEEAHSSIYTERVETSVNVEPSITLSLALNKGNIASVNLTANNRESAWKVNNISHDQPNQINSRNEDITQPKENDEFTEPTLWKLNSRMLDNPFISKEIKDDLKDMEATSDWITIRSDVNQFLELVSHLPPQKLVYKKFTRE
ncbi:26684_t:CDS:2 [Gigaspora margarita]|uniref:26684_t:CDS:1 n=1 Tax=Gigaspora margarita TaxID=4874 RepID=A0ABN7WDC3_GIGMA|nr:26684_t:CDS:2 [Gigaspora margarita]